MNQNTPHIERITPEGEKISSPSVTDLFLIFFEDHVQVRSPLCNHGALARGCPGRSPITSLIDFFCEKWRTIDRNVKRGRGGPGGGVDSQLLVDDASTRRRPAQLTNVTRYVSPWRLLRILMQDEPSSYTHQDRPFPVVSTRTSTLHTEHEND